MAAAGGGTPGSTPAPGRWGGLLQPLEAVQRSSGIIWHFSPHHPDRACGTARQRAHKEWDEEAFENDSRHQRERGPTALQWGGTNVLTGGLSSSCPPGMNSTGMGWKGERSMHLQAWQQQGGPSGRAER